MAAAKQRTGLLCYLIWAFMTRSILAAPASTESILIEDTISTTTVTAYETTETTETIELQSLNISTKSQNNVDGNDASTTSALSDDNSERVSEGSTSNSTDPYVGRHAVTDPTQDESTTSQPPEVSSSHVTEVDISTTPSSLAALIRVLNALTDSLHSSSTPAAQSYASPTMDTYERREIGDFTEARSTTENSADPPSTVHESADAPATDSRQNSKTLSALQSDESSETPTPPFPELSSPLPEKVTELATKESIESQNGATDLSLEARENLDTVVLSEKSTSSSSNPAESSTSDSSGSLEVVSNSTPDAERDGPSSPSNQDTTESLDSKHESSAESVSFTSTESVLSRDSGAASSTISDNLVPESQNEQSTMALEDQRNPTSESTISPSGSLSEQHNSSTLLSSQSRTAVLLNGTGQSSDESGTASISGTSTETAKLPTTDSGDATELLLNATDLLEVLTTLESLNVSLNDIALDVGSTGSERPKPSKISQIVLETDFPHPPITTTRSTSISGDKLLSNTPLQELLNSTTINVMDLTTVSSIVHLQSTPSTTVLDTAPYQFYVAANTPKTSCTYNGQQYSTGEHVTQFDPCQFCVCVNGYLDCYWKNCPPPPEGCVELDFEGVCDRSLYLCPIPKRGEPLPFPVNSISKFRRDVSNNKLSCDILGVEYKVGELVGVASDPCMECRCAVDNLYCSPKCCFQPIGTGSDPTKNSRANDALWHPILPHPLKHLRSEFENQ